MVDFYFWLALITCDFLPLILVMAVFADNYSLEQGWGTSASKANEAHEIIWSGPAGESAGGIKIK